MISYQKYRDMLLDPRTPDEDILPYIIIEPVDGSLTFTFRPNPQMVEATEIDLRIDWASNLLNNLERYRRQERFRQRISSGEVSNLPILVAEGDSWFQFPFAIKDIVKQLESSYLIWSLGASGDTLENITDTKKRGPNAYEYLAALRSLKPYVKGFLFSAAGNDIIGHKMQPDGTVGRALQSILQSGDGSDVPSAYVDLTALENRLSDIRVGYQKVVSDIRSEPGLENLPIFMHGYDYVYPYSWRGEGDSRSYIWSRPLGKWLGLALDHHNINNEVMRRNIIKYLIDKLYELLNEFSEEDQNIHVIDCRNSMPDFEDWIDEIHGTNDGFAKVAKLFSKEIEKAIRSV